MIFTKILGLAAAAALALLSFASTASATTLEVKGVKQTAGITLKMSLKSGTSLLKSDTSGFFINTCTVSTIEATTETNTTDENGQVTKATAAGTNPITGPITALSWSSCKEGNPTVHAAGTLSIAWISKTTNGTVSWSNSRVTTPSPLGLLTCTTPATGTDLGTLTGVAAGFATIDVSAILSCGIDVKLTGTYLVTSPEGLGVIE